ncbi:hypothetical protein NQ318_016780 [Aromia moschata]|uniref:Uncharacterized protein n=1 Tax=Aromia moschata TaxID=1265417 RepID=A0AAV8Y500_9CUCU|nr:hypothetical protein NQ318_016780 [Aromia moschata]
MHPFERNEPLKIGRGKVLPFDGAAGPKTSRKWRFVTFSTCQFSPKMVCLYDESLQVVTVRDTIQQSAKRRSDIQVTPTKTIESIFKEISRDFEYNADEIELVLQRRDGTTYVLNEHRDKTVQEAGVTWNPSEHLYIIISQLKNKTMSLYVQDVAEDDLLLGASASPTTGETPGGSCDAPPVLLNEFDDYPRSTRSHAPPRSSTSLTATPPPRGPT